jgi:hypothetical protein
VLLKWGLTKGVTRDMVSPLIEEAMMYTSAVGVELLHVVGEVFEAIDKESVERGVELTNGWRDMGRVDCWTGEIDI